MFLRSSQVTKREYLFIFCLTFLLRFNWYIKYCIEKVDNRMPWHMYTPLNLSPHSRKWAYVSSKSFLVPFAIHLFYSCLDSQLHIVNSGSPLTLPVLLFPKHWRGNFLKAEIWKHFRNFLICFPSLWDHYHLTYFVFFFSLLLLVVVLLLLQMGA